MTKAHRKGKRNKARRHRRKHLRQPFGQIIYWREELTRSGRRIKLKPREFRSYEDAATHLACIKLGIEKEKHPWNTYKVHKINGGYRRNSQKVLTYSKVIEEPKSEVNNECSSMGWEGPVSRRVRQQRKFMLPVSQNMGAIRTASVTGWGNWPSASCSSTTTVDGTGTSTVAVPINSWDKLPFSALV